MLNGKLSQRTNSHLCFVCASGISFSEDDLLVFIPKMTLGARTKHLPVLTEIYKQKYV